MHKEITSGQELVDYIATTRPLQSKKLKANFASVPTLQFELEKFLDTYKPYLVANSISHLDLADAYITMVDQMTCARMAFLRKGVYPASDHASVVETVYADESVMKKYMLGLALSQFLWKHHFNLFDFYRREIRKTGAINGALEVGSGHGLFLLELLKARGELQRVEVVDISAHSLALSKSLIQTLRPAAASFVRFTNSDVKQFKANQKFDFITMGEVLEHVPAPVEILTSLHELLADRGHLYISTCINCPTVDHIYHFRSVEEIQALIAQAGFTVDSEVIAPSENRAPEELEKFKVDISYGAILKKK